MRHSDFPEQLLPARIYRHWACKVGMEHGRGVIDARRRQESAWQMII